MTLPRMKHITEQTALQARKLAQEGKSRYAIAALLQISPSTAWWLLYGESVLTDAVRALNVTPLDYEPLRDVEWPQWPTHAH